MPGTVVQLEEILRCPRCLAPVEGLSSGTPRCSSAQCLFFREGFRCVAGTPVLLDFERSIFDPALLAEGSGSVLPRVYEGPNRRFRRRLLFGHNDVAEANAVKFLAALRSRPGVPRVLVVGGGVLGSGADALYSGMDIEIVGLDVYPSPYTHLIADAHQLPFASETFDGVWIQAVLEHVLDPQKVVAEIFRVLRPQGLVYSEIPFMQQVHEGAYDFTRFTRSGQRWLFRQFDQIDAGVVGGAGSAAFWSVRYLFRSLGLERTRLALPMFWLRFLDRWARPRANADAASCLYFFGSKSESTLHPRDIVAYYKHP